MDIFVAKFINLHLKKKYLLFKILNSYKNAKFLIKKKYQCENIALCNNTSRTNIEDTSISPKVFFAWCTIFALIFEGESH